jgi:hypothetical protein
MVVLPQNQRHLRDRLGSPISDGACVLDDDRGKVTTGSLVQLIGVAR